MLKLDPDGYKIVGFFLVGAILLSVMMTLTGWKLAVIPMIFLCIAVVFSVYFFRDPERNVPEDESLVVSSADGVVVDISIIDAEGLENNKALRIAVFMNVFNVHVNRIPVAGKILGTIHRNGKKLSAYNKRAEHENEHADTDIEMASGALVRVRQIAGLVARRVVTRVNSGDILEKGDRIGLIRFGSRVDVFLPVDYEPQVSLGDHVTSGETVLALAKSPM